jgi:hypothetical protein
VWDEVDDARHFIHQLLLQDLARREVHNSQLILQKSRVLELAVCVDVGLHDIVPNLGILSKLGSKSDYVTEYISPRRKMPLD